MNCISKLVSIGSEAIMGPPKSHDSYTLNMGSRVRAELFELLTLRNGFYAFQSALHIFPIGTAEGIMDLESWNADTLWRNGYGRKTEHCLFFAEDIFGGQFCIHEDKVCYFEPETGELEDLAPNLESWACLILEDYQVLTGYLLAHRWQKENGPLSSGKRLLPKVPFILEGAFEVDNVYAADAVEGMRFRGDLARQLDSIPDGANVKIKVWSSSRNKP